MIMPKAAANTIVEIGKSTNRAYGAAASLITGKPFQPQGQFQQDLYGTTKPITLTSVGRETRGANPEGESKGILKTVDPALGVFAGRIKSRSLLVTYIILIVIIIGMAVVAGFVCFSLAGIIPDNYKPTVDEAARIACEKRLNGCCCCDQNLEDHSRCPEWSSDEIIDIIVRDIQLVGSGSFICVIYLGGALVVSSICHHSLKNYKSDYV